MHGREIGEMIFNVLYLVFIWDLVVKMFKNKDSLSGKNAELGKLLLIIFGLLALGDTGHVGFRVLAYLKGGIEANASLVGFGKASTAFTMTIFYMLLVQIWRVRFNKNNTLFTYFLLLCGFARLIIVLLPGNQWGSLVPPFSWEMYRNIPLMILGLGIAILIFQDAKRTGDNTFKWFSIMIFVSYAFYIPVILFARVAPLIGFLMIPKTVAYLVAAFISYNGVFK